MFSGQVIEQNSNKMVYIAAYVRLMFIDGFFYFQSNFNLFMHDIKIRVLEVKKLKSC